MHFYILNGFSCSLMYVLLYTLALKVCLRAIYFQLKKKYFLKLCCLQHSMLSAYFKYIFAGKNIYIYPIICVCIDKQSPQTLPHIHQQRPL